MIISIAGTSGAGKTHLVRSIMALAPYRHTVMAGEVDPEWIRRLPVGIILRGIGPREVFVAGNYPEEYDTGGCDTIKDVERNFKMIWAQHQAERHVIFEGLFMMNHTRGPRLVRQVGGHAVTVIRLTTPLADCFKAINDRRAARGDGPLENKENTENNDVRAGNYARKMRDAGAAMFRLDREAAYYKVRELLR